jgi:hypothetical protein
MAPVPVPSDSLRTSTDMEDQELLDQVRSLREREFTPAEIARALGIGKAKAVRLARTVATESKHAGSDRHQPGADRSVAPKRSTGARCWVSPGWRDGLQVDGRFDWPGAGGAPADASDSGVAFVLLALPGSRDRLSVCGYLVDTWCLGVKNALGPQWQSPADVAALRRVYFRPWESDGVPVPLEFAQHLVLGAVEYARSLGFEPHPDFKQARPALGPWHAPSAITFGYNGKPLYINGPYDDPDTMLATLERSVGRDGFDFVLSLGQVDDLDDVA